MAKNVFFESRMACACDSKGYDVIYKVLEEIKYQKNESELAHSLTK